MILSPLSIGSSPLVRLSFVSRLLSFVFRLLSFVFRLRKSQRSLSLCVGMRKKTLSGGNGFEGGGGAGGGAAFSSSASPSASASSFASAASLAALAFASCTAFVFSSGKIAGCRMTKRIAADTPNLMALGETTVNTVLSTTPKITLTKNRVTIST